MSRPEADAETLGLAEFVAAVIEEIAEGVHRSQISQEEDARELATIAALEPDDVAERLVSLESAEAYVANLEDEAGVVAAWPKGMAALLRLVSQRLDLRLVRGQDFDRDGLTRFGRDRLIRSSRNRLAVDQLEAVRRLLREGAPRIRISGGEFTVKLEIQSRRVAMESHPTPAAQPRTGVTPPALAPLRPADRVGRAALRDVRISVRPALRQDQDAAAIMGEFKITFVTLG